VKTKKCFKCDIEQPIVNFYRHPQMGDGRLNKCKSCTRYDVRKNYAAKIEQYREYDRQRYQADPKKRTPKQRAPQKRRAEIALHNAVARGKIKRLRCQMCDDPKSEAHHPDYSKPLDVMWLCRKHHKDIHRMNPEAF